MDSAEWCLSGAFGIILRMSNGTRKTQKHLERMRAKAAGGTGSYTPPIGVRAAARRGIQLVEQGRAGDGLETATVGRARSLAAGRPQTARQINRMHSFFSRHAVDRKRDWGKPGEETPGYVAWQLWGGDAGASWAAGLADNV